HNGVFRDRGGDRGGFLGNPPGGIARAAFGDLANFEATKAELATDIVEALAVALGKLSFRSLLQPADGNDENTHARTLTCAPADSHRWLKTRCRGRYRALSPQSLKIVELAHLRSEHVQDHVAGIDQYPIAIRQALDMDIFDSVFLQRLRDIFRDCAHVPVHPA